MSIVLAIAIFLGAALLFLAEPMVARMLLPMLGGSPSVWNTAMVFFQAILLGGYVLAHVLSRRMGPTRGGLVFLGLIVLAGVALPIGVPGAWTPPASGSPIPWLLGALAVGVGPPMLVVAITGPMIQRLLGSTRHRSAHDPYFLYVASNAGSLLALLAYPAIVEPMLTLRSQALAWSIGYGLYGAAVLACVVLVRRHGRSADAAAGLAPNAERAVADAPDGRSTWRRRATWVLLAFVPSSLMLGVTAHLSTDIAAVPLLWVVPLAVYLLTFMLAFSRRDWVPIRTSARLLPIMAVALGVAALLEAARPIGVLVAMHLLGLFLGGMLCHGRLAAMRPPISRLTEFYLMIAIGGVMGGMFNALLAPMIFDRPFEYPIVLVLACLLRPVGGSREPARGKEPSTKRRRGRVAGRGNRRRRGGRENRRGIRAPGNLSIAVINDALWPILLLIAMAAIELHFRGRRGDAGAASGYIEVALRVGLPALVCFLFVARPRRFALGLAVLFVLAAFRPSPYGRLVLEERTFFGVHRVYDETIRPADAPAYHVRRLLHGNTIHGIQVDRDEDTRDLPRAYYHPDGPAGDLFLRVLGSRPGMDRGDAQAPVVLRDAALVGLGTGALAAYAMPGQRFVFYEIDPEVVRIARDPRLFTYISDSRATVEFVLGDARLRLGDAPESAYDAIVLDAFSSDAIPVHLLTREAMDLYLSRLRPGGVIAFHISNRYLDLRPVVGALADDAGLIALVRRDFYDETSPEGRAAVAAYRLKSAWVVVTDNQRAIHALIATGQWDQIAPSRDVWTDDRSNILSVFEWGP